MIVVAIAAAAISAGLASAQPSPGCASANMTTSECPASYAGFHYLCGMFSYQAAVEACTDLGYRLAVLDDANAAQALYTQRDCIFGTTAEAWVSAWDGLGADPCMILSASSAVQMTNGWERCSERRSVMCQDLPEGVYTVRVSIIAAATMTGATTTTTTICTNCGTSLKAAIPTLKAAAAQGGGAVEKQRGRGSDYSCGCDRSRPETCTFNDPPRCPLGECTPVCRTRLCGLYVVQLEGMTYAQAQQECAKYGWTLADITTGMWADVAFLGERCVPDAAGNALWIRSYNGVDGGACIKAQPEEGNLQIGFGIPGEADPFCTTGPFLGPDRLPYALCQERPPQQTGTGVFVGEIEFSTTTLTLPTTTTVFNGTQTVTVTEYYEP